MSQQQSYVATPNPVNPTAVQGLFPLWLTNAPGSEYAAQHGYESTIHLDRVIRQSIVDSIRPQFGSIKPFLDKAPEYRPQEEYTWTEEVYARPAFVSTANVAGGATMVIPLTANGAQSAVVNDVINLPSGTPAVISAVDIAANTITIRNYNGTGNLPNVSINDKITVTFPAIADGMNSFVHYDRMRTISYTNYMSSGQRNKRWTFKTALAYKNSNRTDYFERDFANMMNEAMRDMFSLIWNGKKGEIDIVLPGANQPYKAKINDGIFPFMQKNGARHSVSSPATLQNDFTTLAINTNYQTSGKPRLVFGSPKAIHQLSKIWKDPIRYAPSDTSSSKDLTMYHIGSQLFVPIEVPAFESYFNMFEESFENRLFVLDMDKIIPVTLTGASQLTMGNTVSLSKNQGGGGYNDYVDWYVSYIIGLEIHTVDGMFWIDLINI